MVATIGETGEETMKKIFILALTAIGALLLIEAPSWGKGVSSCRSNSRHPVTRCHVVHRNLGVGTTDGSRQTKRHPNLLSVPVPPPASRSPDIPVANGSLRELKDFGQGQSRDPSGDSGHALAACLTCPNLVQSGPELTLAADQKPRTAGLVDLSARIANAAGEQKVPTARLVDSSARRAKAAGRRRQMGHHNNVYGMTGYHNKVYGMTVGAIFMSRSIVPFTPPVSVILDFTMALIQTLESCLSCTGIQAG
jgi:hypothetical protein